MIPGFVLLVWPFIALALFAALGPMGGLIWATTVGYLFLPEGFSFNLPGLPNFGKTAAISLSILIGIWVSGRSSMPDKTEIASPALNRIFKFLFVALLLSAVFTVMTNRFPTLSGGSLRPALSPRDLVAMTAEMLYILVPFFLARRWLATPERHQQLLLAIVALGLFYTLLALFEIRMSPQLNRWVYGYFPHSWAQHVRGGFRPIVFLNHGIWLGFFFFTVVIASFALSRHMKGRMAVLLFGAGVWTTAVLLVSRNLGALILVIVLVPVVLLLTTRLQARVAALAAVLFLSYPALHQFDLVPLEKITSTVADFAPNRAASFNFRIENERALLERANLQPVFGWGGWSRGHIFNENGRLISTTDGYWIIVLGDRGWFGYLALFALLTLPLLFLARTARRKPLPYATAGLATIAAGNVIYMIPNATLTPVDLLIYGAIAGFVLSDVPVRDESARPAQEAGDRQRTRYTRFAPRTPDAPDRASETGRRAFSRFPE